MVAIFRVCRKDAHRVGGCAVILLTMTPVLVHVPSSLEIGSLLRVVVSTPAMGLI